MPDIHYTKLPPYVRWTVQLAGVCMILGLLSYGRTLFLPVAFSLLFSILLRPVVVFFNARLRFPHVIAVLTTVVLFSLFIIALLIFIYWQISWVMNDWSKLQHNFYVHYGHLRHWIHDNFNISYNTQEEYFSRMKDESLDKNPTLIGNTIVTFTGVLASAVLVPIYTFLILLYRNLFIRFISMLLRNKYQDEFAEIMLQIKMVVQSYLVGLMTEMAIVITLTTLGLMIVGVPYALLLGTITAILNLIPYIGLLIAAVVTCLTALITSTEASVIFGAILVNVIVQLIDNNILVPRIVGTKVQINAFVSMSAVISGGIVAGIAGMFLSIPLVAILKVIFDNIEPLKPWGYVMGDDLPKTFEWRKIKLTSLDAGTLSATSELKTPPEITVVKDEDKKEF
jgi:predicted PurR-regulated permease PerM